MNPISPINGNGKPQQLNLLPLQLAALLVLDGCSAALQTGMNQLGAFLGLKREADILAERLKDLTREKEKLIADWSRTIQVVSAMPPTSIIPSKS